MAFRQVLAAGCLWKQNQDGNSKRSRDDRQPEDQPSTITFIDRRREACFVRLFGCARHLRQRRNRIAAPENVAPAVVKIEAQGHQRHLRQ